MRNGQERITHIRIMFESLEKFCNLPCGKLRKVNSAPNTFPKGDTPWWVYCGRRLNEEDKT